MRRQAVMLAAALVLFSPVASAYYYWVFYASGTGPYAPLMAHFDLNAIKDNTVQYFISDQAPGPLLPGDNITAIYSEIRQAAAVWDGVGSSALRLHFGGTRNLATPQTVPGIDVVFDDDMPPGIVALTKLTFPADLKFLSAKETTFVPILRARVQMRKDLTATGQHPSYADEFFTTLVHEFGHALGLQHTLTSATMSTAITRATMRGVPLAADDVAGISLLYPSSGLTGGYAASTGSIAGKVTAAADGSGVNLASVVALSTSGVAISGMTQPDGTYRIDGIPAGQYYVYAHPLPPAQQGESTPANIVPPADAQNDAFPANTKFITQFFPGTQDWTKATAIGVVAGKTATKIDFSVAASAGPAVYGMQTYGYPNGVAIAAPPLVTKTRTTLVFYANGSTVDNQTAIAPGLSVGAIGGAASIEAGSLKYYQQGFSLAVVNTAEVSVDTPVALAVTLNGDLYVLPAAFTVVPSPAPSISTVTKQTASAFQVVTTITGANLTANTRILFDGSPAKLLWANTTDGSLAVTEPAGLSGRQATVEAVNPDGQTSLQSLGTTPRPLFTYPQLNTPQIYAWPDTVTAGTDTLLLVNGIDTNFAEGETVVGFGSSDISVRRTWVVGPRSIVLDLSVDPGTVPGTTNITVSTGLETVTAVGSLNIAAADAHQMSLRVPIVNAVTGLAGIPAGGTALIATSGLPANLDGWVMSIGLDITSFTVDKNGVLSAFVPGDVPTGPQVVRLTAPTSVSTVPIPTVFLQVDPPPPVIQAAVDTPVPTSTDPKAPVVPAYPVSAATPAQLGDTVTLTVSGLSASTGSLPPASAVWVNLGGNLYPVTAVTAVPADPNAKTPPPDLAYVNFVVPKTLVVDATVSNPTVPLMVGTGTRLSAAFALYVPPPPPPPPATP